MTMLELHFQDTDVTAGSIPVTWCLDKETLEKLKQFPEPMLVIAVVPIVPESVDDGFNHSHMRTEQRYVVPIQQAMTYVSFRKPGLNRIFAFIDTSQSKRAITRHWLETSNKTFDASIVNFHGDGYGNSITSFVADEFRSAAVDIDVPKEAFAAEPSEFEQDWVCWLLDRGADQCGFRRRRIFAYTLQLLILLVNMIIRLMFFIVAAAIGSRGTSFKYLFHPLTYDLSPTIDGLFTDGSIFIPRKPSLEECDDASYYGAIWWFLRKLYRLPFMPPIAVGLFLINHFHHWHVVGFVAVVLVILIVIIGIVVSGVVGKWIQNMINRLFASDEEWSQDVDDLVCDGTAVKPLRRKRRTVRLRYLALKAKVCRPFAG